MLSVCITKTVTVMHFRMEIIMELSLSLGRMFVGQSSKRPTVNIVAINFDTWSPKNVTTFDVFTFVFIR